jgi:hypothetical protein
MAFAWSGAGDGMHDNVLTPRRISTSGRRGMTVEIAFLLQSEHTILAVDLKFQRNSTNQNHCRRTQPVSGGRAGLLPA